MDPRLFYVSILAQYWKSHHHDLLRNGVSVNTNGKFSNSDEFKHICAEYPYYLMLRFLIRESLVQARKGHVSYVSLHNPVISIGDRSFQQGSYLEHFVLEVFILMHTPGPLPIS